MTKLSNKIIKDRGYVLVDDKKYGNEPSHKEINEWFENAFGHKPYEDTYIQEWYNRFSSPIRVWSHSDYQRRKSLKKTFPNKFGRLSIKTNLNNPEYANKDKWNYW